MKHTNKLYGIGALAIAASAIGGGASVASQALPDASPQPDSATLTVMQSTSDGSEAFSCSIDIPQGVGAGESGAMFTVFSDPANLPGGPVGAVTMSVADPSGVVMEAGGNFMPEQLLDAPDVVLLDPTNTRVGTDEECAAFDVSVLENPVTQVIDTTDPGVLSGSAVMDLEGGTATFAQVDENGEGFRCSLDLDELIAAAPIGGLTATQVVGGATFDAALAPAPGELDGGGSGVVVMQAGSIAVPDGAAFEPIAGFEPTNIDELREGTAEECEAAQSGFGATIPAG